VCAAPGSKTFQLLEIIHQSSKTRSLPDGMVCAVLITKMLISVSALYSLFLSCILVVSSILIFLTKEISKFDL